MKCKHCNTKSLSTKGVRNVLDWGEIQGVCLVLGVGGDGDGSWGTLLYGLMDQSTRE